MYRDVDTSVGQETTGVYKSGHAGDPHRSRGCRWGQAPMGAGLVWEGGGWGPSPRFAERPFWGGVAGSEVAGCWSIQSELTPLLERKGGCPNWEPKNILWPNKKAFNVFFFVKAPTGINPQWGNGEERGGAFLRGLQNDPEGLVQRARLIPLLLEGGGSPLRGPRKFRSKKSKRVRVWTRGRGNLRKTTYIKMKLYFTFRSSRIWQSFMIRANRRT